MTHTRTSAQPAPAPRGRQALPHKPLLALLALARIDAVGSSAIPWVEARQQLGNLLVEFGPTSTASAPQSAAYPFTRLRSDDVWVLDEDVPMDRIGPLDRHHVTGRFVESVEHALKDRRTLYATARALVEAEFPPSVAGDVLTAVGFDPDEIYGSPADLAIGGTGTPPARRRSAHWPAQILASWDPPVRLLRVRRTVGVRPTFMGDFALKRTHAEDDST